MPDLAVLSIGQSNSRSTKAISGGNKSIPANCMAWNNDETKLGTKFLPFKFGRYPFNIRTYDGTIWANNLSLSFCREASASWTPRLVMVAKGGHEIECFIRKITRQAKGWKFRAGKVDLAAFVYEPKLGIMRALRALRKPHYDVVVFHQGEANNQLSAAQYTERFLALRANLIGLGAITSSTPIIVGGLFTGGKYYATHKGAMLAIAANYPQVKFVDSDGLASNDGLHFDGASITTLGQRYWAAFEAA